MPAQKGFTLVELLVVIVIISILMVIVIAAMKPDILIGRAKDTALRSTMTDMGYAINSWRSSENSFPTKTQLLTNLNGALDIGTNAFSFPVQTGTLDSFYYGITSDGNTACLSAHSLNDGHNVLWCSDGGTFIEDDSSWCYADGTGGCP